MLKANQIKLDISRRATMRGALALGSSLLLPGASAAKAGEKLTFFRIGTGPTAETLYFLGTALSAGISRPPGGLDCDQGGLCGVPGLIAVAQSNSGSIPNIEDMMKGRLESALVHSDIAYRAYKGTGPFQYYDPFEGLRNIANLGNVKLHVVVRADSDIKTPRDLAGKRVSLGTSGSGTIAIVRRLLQLYGIKTEQVIPFFMKPGPAADWLEKGKLDAFFEFGADPIDAIEDLHGRSSIRLLDIPRENAATLNGFHPFVRHSEIPAVYRDLPPTSTLSLGVMWVVRQDADPSLVERITRALWQGEAADLFRLSSPDHAFPTLEQAAQDSFVPLHEGALAYYKSAGVT